MTKSTRKRPDTAVASVRVLKTAETSNISGTAEITYQLGTDLDDNLVMRISSSTGGGFFSREWIPVDDILGILQDWDATNGITSVALTKLFRGKSVNSKAFLLAALRAEGVIKPLEGKQRNHELDDVAGFLERVKQLQAGKPAPRTGTKKKARAKAKAAAKSPQTRKKPTS